MVNRNIAVGLLIIASSVYALGQNPVDSTRLHIASAGKSSALRGMSPDKFSMMVYLRTIRGADGNVRIDENIVPNIRLNRWLRLEAGIRFGQRPQHFESYYGYKVELQTKRFFEKVRFFVRLSDRIIKYPSPTYINSNFMAVAEGRQSLSSHFIALASFGYVHSTQKNNSVDGWPLTSGTKTDYPTYKLGVRYIMKGMTLEGTWGGYDVFNPYPVNSPFVQVTFDRDLSELCTFYSYFRYQYYKTLDVELTEFLCLGVRLHLVKETGKR